MLKGDSFLDIKLFTDLRRANLCGAAMDGAVLTGAHLDGANLEGAYLTGAVLAGAHMEGALLVGAHLNDAYLINAYLIGAELGSADLTGAQLWAAHLNDADLRNADLTGANLASAHLEGAHLNNAHLNNADLSFANVADADFDFDVNSPPKAVPGLYTARNLQLVKFTEQPAGLVKLRGEFKDLGLRTQENQLTYAIRRSELSRRDPQQPGGPYVHSWSERTFNTLFFDWTCQYGISPGRPILIVAALAMMLSIVYIFAQIDPGPNAGIWAVWDEHSIKLAEGSKEPSN